MGNTKKILIVEDSADILRVMTHVLAVKGYEPIPLSSGREAMDHVKEHNPQLIILDMFLEDYDGMEICRAIKSDPAFARIPVIMTTGHREDEFNTADPTKPDAYLLKPFEMEDLLTKIAELINA